MRSTQITRRSLLAALPAGLAAPALAQPVTRDVRWIVGFAAGGSVDAMARIVAAAIGPQIGRNVVVENRTGAGGFIGLQAVANSAPDGHVLAIASGFNLSVSPVLPGMTMPEEPETFLGSFWRETAVARDELQWVATGHRLVEALVGVVRDGDAGPEDLVWLVEVVVCEIAERYPPRGEYPIQWPRTWR
jgi:hypothetical protein